MVFHLSRARFVTLNVVIWVVMVVILVVVPDALEAWMPLQFARIVGWAVAGGVWVIAVERHWQIRVGAFMRFVAQLVLWVSAAMLAIWISDQFRVHLY